MSDDALSLIKLQTRYLPTKYLMTCWKMQRALDGRKTLRLFSALLWIFVRGRNRRARVSKSPPGSFPRVAAWFVILIWSLNHPKL